MSDNEVNDHLKQTQNERIWKLSLLNSNDYTKLIDGKGLCTKDVYTTLGSNHPLLPIIYFCPTFFDPLHKDVYFDETSSPFNYNNCC